MSGNLRSAGAWTTAILALGMAFWAGCPVTAPMPTQAPVHEARLGTDGARYYLYVPSTYDPAREYPLVILCHGTEPWDSAWAQIREWAAFAEQNRIIVAAPRLVGTRGDFRPPPARQIELQRQDEETILDLVGALKASRRIAEERVFLAGWSAGSFAVLHTGLKQPDVFRALAIRQGTFDAAFLGDVDLERLDRWQPIFVYYARMDALRDESIACIRWLREQRLFVEQLEQPGSHRRVEVQFAWTFFTKIVRERPWIRLRAARPDLKNRRRVQFWMDAWPAARSARWDFGDGQTSAEPNPSHEYAAGGTYEAACTVTLKAGRTYRRTIRVQIGPP